MMRAGGLTYFALIALVSTTACIRPHGPEDIRYELAAEAGIELHREMGITVTRSGMAFARWGMKIAGEDDISLKGVRRVEVGVYEVDGLRRGHAERLPLARPDLEGWATLVEVHDSGEDVFVMAQLAEDDRIRRLLVIVAEEDEWTLVRLKGKLDAFLEEAMEYAFEEAGHPDLYADSPRQPGWEKPVSAREEEVPASIGSDTTVSD